MSREHRPAGALARLLAEALVAAYVRHFPHHDGARELFAQHPELRSGGSAYYRTAADYLLDQGVRLDRAAAAEEPEPPEQEQAPAPPPAKPEPALPPEPKPAPRRQPSRPNREKGLFQ